MSEDTLTVTDNRTGKTYEIPIRNGTIHATDLRQIKAGPEDFGLMCYDPAYMNTATCTSTITYLDGNKGVLEYRGYPIEQLAEHSSYLEVAYLLLYGELPSQERLAWWVSRIRRHTFIHNSLVELIRAFR
jgi:citrate synthase